MSGRHFDSEDPTRIRWEKRENTCPIGAKSWNAAMDKIDALNRELASADKHNDKLGAESHDLRGKVSMAEGRIKVLAQRLADAQEEAHQKTAIALERDNAMHELVIVKERLATANENYMTGRGFIAKLENELKDLQHRLAEALDACSELDVQSRVKLEAADSEVVRLTKENADWRRIIPFIEKYKDKKLGGWDVDAQREIGAVIIFIWASKKAATTDDDTCECGHPKRAHFHDADGNARECAVPHCKAPDHEFKAKEPATAANTPSPGHEPLAVTQDGQAPGARDATAAVGSRALMRGSNARDHEAVEAHVKAHPEILENSDQPCTCGHSMVYHGIDELGKAWCIECHGEARYHVFKVKEGDR